MRDLFKDARTKEHKKNEQNNTYNRLKEKYRLKDYSERFRSLYNTCKWFSYICNISSIITSFSFLYFLQGNSPNISAIAVCIGVLFGIESLKRFVAPTIAREYLQYKTISPPLVLVLGGLVGLSLFFSFKGSKTLHSQLSPPPLLVSIDSLALATRGAIKEAKEGINRIQNGKEYKWRGAIVGEGKERIKRFEESIARAEKSLEAERQRIEATNAEIKNTHATETEERKTNLSYLALLLDLSLIASLVFMERYDYNSYLDFRLHQTEEIERGFKISPPSVVPRETETETIGETVADVPRETETETERKMEEDTETETVADVPRETTKTQAPAVSERTEGEKWRKCLECNTHLINSTKRKKYCSDACRLRAYKRRNGNGARYGEYIESKEV